MTLRTIATKTIAGGLNALIVLALPYLCLPSVVFCVDLLRLPLRALYEVLQ